MKIPPTLIAPLLYPLYRLWCRTLRVEEAGRELIDSLAAEGRLLAVALWHDELFSLVNAKRHLKIATLVSASRDGEYLAQVMQRFGLHCVRGSSSRGGVGALHEMLNLMRNENFLACVTVDGPRGPRHRIKDGVFFMAARSGGLLAPVRIFYEKAWTFKSWDRFQLPKPFSRVRIAFAVPYAVESADLSKDDLDKEKSTLQVKMDELERAYAFKN